MSPEKRDTPRLRRLAREEARAIEDAERLAAAPSPESAATPKEAPWTIDFWEDDDGNKPVLNWIKNDLTPTQRRALGSAMRHVLQQHGLDVCDGHWGSWVETNIAEFRLHMTGEEVVNAGWATADQIDTSETVFLRVFFHAHGDKIILLLEGYDKGAAPAKSIQTEKIKIAKLRLTAWRLREQKAKKARRRGAAEDGPP